MPPASEVVFSVQGMHRCWHAVVAMTSLPALRMAPQAVGLPSYPALPHMPRLSFTQAQEMGTNDM
jgi:hypothetical protein